MKSKKPLLLIILAVLVLIGLAGYGDFPATGRKLANFPITHLLGALGLAGLNYGLRWCRWEYYLRLLRVHAPLSVRSLVFLSGLAMSITPGKAGELLKSYLLRDRANVPVSLTVPVVVMERVTDVLAVALLALVGLALLPAQLLVLLVATLAVCVVALGVATSRRGEDLFRLPWLRRWRSELLHSQAGLRRLAVPGVMVPAVLLATGAWLCEGVALWLILRGLDTGASLLRAVPIYAAATLVGAITALPGGLVGTEGSMVALLQQSGISRGASSAGTLLVRLVTLWFAVAVGLAALICLNRIRIPGTAAPGKGEPDDSRLRASL